MCGILYAQLKSDSVADGFEKDFRSAVELQKYRGPDHTGICRYRNHFFGHVRLSIIDVSDASNQPLESPRSILLFNGEIYNHKEIDPTSKSDTHTLLKRIEALSDRCQELNVEGMYAILHFDKKSETVTVYRDFFGEKPLYCYEDERVLIIASTLRPIAYLLSRCFDKTLPLLRSAMEEFLLFGFVRDPKTIYANIRQIRAGHRQSFSPEGKKCERYESSPRTRGTDDFKRYLINSVEATDVCPVLLLSSGVDSTYLLSQIARHGLNSKVCIYKSSNAKTDESEPAQRNLSQVLPGVEPLIVENEMDDIRLYELQIAMMEQPSSHGMQIINILSGLKRFAPGTKLILTGLGGDELYGGYNSFKHLTAYMLLRRFPWQLCPRRYRRFFEIRFSNEARYPVPAYYFKYRLNTDAVSFLGKACDLQGHFDCFRREVHLDRLDIDEPHRQLKFCEAFDYMKNQLLRDGDNISMFYGIESRSPLLYPAATYGPERNRKTFRRELAKQRGVKISRKRGFTLGENKKRLAGHFKTQALARNDELQLFPRQAIEALPPAEEKFELLKRLYILLSWIRSRNQGNLAFDIRKEQDDRSSLETIRP